MAFVISEDKEMFKALCRTVELLQGSTAIISQYYYGCLFHELLAFQLADRHPRVQVSMFVNSLVKLFIDLYFIGLCN